MRQVAFVVLVMACKQAGDDYPVLPPGPDDPHPTLTDAAIPDGHPDGAPNDSMSNIAGRVCLITDPRNQAACKATGAGGLAVTVGTKSATTAADGTFTIGVPTGTSLVWHVTGTQLQTSVMPFGSVAQIPAMLAADYFDLEAQNGASVQNATQGEVFVSVVHTGAPLAKATASSIPQSAYGPLYDGLTPSSWTTLGTAAAGMVWFPGIATGAPTLITVTPMNGSALAIPNVPVEGQAITWIAVDVP